ncbi:hypothetical protein GCM10010502_26640 [Kitasatospora aureofaciens]|uniref:Uncharacterized protein n=1 Tax=Kitasatospora aureofaciens TaxID=1894 RepID=A0A8H9HNY6_KITAU|nr:hypothetical protein GCM10010502_26640 [Kitasatospora aureofaciens]
MGTILRSSATASSRVPSTSPSTLLPQVRSLPTPTVSSTTKAQRAMLPSPFPFRLFRHRATLPRGTTAYPYPTSDLKKMVVGRNVPIGSAA